MSQNLQNRPTHVIFREEQRFTQWWIFLIIAAVSALMWWMFIQQIVFDKPFGNNPGPDWLVWLLLALVGIALPYMMVTMRLRTLVYPGHIEIRFSFFHKRRIPIDSIISFEACKYRPILEYGGWGIRVRPKRGVAYSMSGNEGVKLKLSSGKPVLIGSQEPKKLARAIEQAKGATQ